MSPRFTRGLLSITGLGALTAALACTIDDDADLTIANRSSTPFTEIRVAEADDEDIGSNRLPAPLMPGEDFQVDDLDCDEYDVLLTTEDVVCEIRSVDVCIDDRTLVIDDDDLGSCLEVAGDPTPDPAEPEPEPDPDPEPDPEPRPDPY
jgi:hypothetical protein